MSNQTPAMTRQQAYASLSQVIAQLKMTKAEHVHLERCLYVLAQDDVEEKNKSVLKED